MAAGLGVTTPADAATFNVTCDVTLLLDGAPSGNLTVAQEIVLTMSAPPEVDAGSTFEMTIPARTVELPAAQQGQTIGGYTDLSTVYQVNGGTPVPGSASGGASISGNNITIANAGPVSPGPLNVPAITFDVTAGAAGTTITARGVSFGLTADLPDLGLEAETVCPIPATPTLSTTQVVAPPPEGAPDAIADTVETDKDTAVDIDVLANDVPDDEFPIDEASLAVVSAPGSGTAEVANGQVTYTPNAGFSGTDSFTYTICSDVPDDVQLEEEPCDVATVTVTVLDTAAAGPTTTAAPAPTSAAPAAQATGGGTLPRTGSANNVLALIGLALVGGGWAAHITASRKLRRS